MENKCCVCGVESTVVWLGSPVCEEHNYYPAYKLVELNTWKKK